MSTSGSIPRKPTNPVLQSSACCGIWRRGPPVCLSQRIWAMTSPALRVSSVGSRYTLRVADGRAAPSLSSTGGRTHCPALTLCPMNRAQLSLDYAAAKRQVDAKHPRRGDSLRPRAAATAGDGTDARGSSNTGALVARARTPRTRRSPPACSAGATGHEFRNARRRAAARRRQLGSCCGCARSDPACARAAGSRRTLSTLAILVTVRTTAMTTSDVPVEISGTASS